MVHHWGLGLFAAFVIEHLLRMPNRNARPNPLAPALTYREIGEQLGISANTAELYVKQAIVSFKEALDKRGIDVLELLDD